MNNSVITSVSPRECELIASGRQTMLVRKTRPKQLETPFKCYIYCSKGKTFLYKNPNNGELFLDSNGGYRGGDYEDRFLTGKVIGEFVCDKVEEIMVKADCATTNGEHWKLLKIAKEACLSKQELKDYIRVGESGYGWHISDLKIYDKPKGLGEFKAWRDCETPEKEYKNCTFGYRHPTHCEYCQRITRPPQSWVYCEPIEEE